MTGDDHARLGDDAESRVTWLGNEAFMTLSGEAGARHCDALILDALDGTFLCSVYERRPEVCRSLARGGGGCLGELDAKRGRPLIALETVRQRSAETRNNF